MNGRGYICAMPSKKSSIKSTSKAAAAKIAVAGAGVGPAAGHFSKVKVEAGKGRGAVARGTGAGAAASAAASGAGGRRRFTGRILVRLKQGVSSAVVEQKAKTRSLKLVSSRDIGSEVLKGLEKVDGVVFERLGVVVVNEGAAEKVKRLLSLRDSPFVSSEPERCLYKQAGARSLKNSAAATWGIQAINVRNSAYTGKDVKMAVLDTGFDFTHPDFAGRVIHRKSFVGRQARDREGHGTFCVGIAGGGRKGKAGPRYGVASGARLYVGKILDDAGEGSDATALAGIEWALEKGCQVISMSFGAAVTPGDGYSEIFEDVARTAMVHNCLLIAATGNESDREEGIVALINHPANCPSVVAVAALTEALKVANYSCAGMRKVSGKSSGGRGSRRGGVSREVNIAAPGDNILSACMGGGHDEESGTSMATPFVAGVVALLWEQFPKASAGEIWDKLIRGVEPIGQPKADVGAGLVYMR